MRILCTQALPLAATAFALFNGYQAQAQVRRNDFLVLSSGDTLRGEIRQRPRFEGAADRKQNQIRFRPKGGQLTVYTAAQVRSYGQDYTVHQVSRSIGGQPEAQFVTPLVVGSVSAYSGQNPQGSKRFYVSLADTARLVELNPQTYRLQYLKLLTGCSTLDFSANETFAKFSLSYKGLTSVVTRYNACRYPQQATQVVRQPSSWHWRPGAKLGLTSSSSYSVANAPFNGDPVRQSRQSAAGVFFRGTNRSPFGAQAELMYTRVKLELEADNVYTGGAPYRMDRLTHVDFATVHAAVLGNLFLYRGRVSPFINAGIVLGLRTQENSTVEYRRSDRPTPEMVAFPASEGPTHGGSIGGGITLNVYKKSLISLEYRYQRLTDGTTRYAPTRDVGRIDLGFSL